MIPTPFPNQPPGYEGGNLFADDALLLAATAAHGLGSSAGALSQWGAEMALPATRELADDANRDSPRLVAFDPRGERIDDVLFDPAWHALMTMATRAGEHCAPWAVPQPGAQRLRAAMYYLHAQVENGTQCPLTMTFAAAAVLARHAGAAHLSPTWLAGVLTPDYDPRPLPAAQKRALLIGMGMTERQGGSDVRANRTEAVASGDRHRITGHKWFFSAPQCDAHLVLAQGAEGLGCYLMPRMLDDGKRNAIRINRLKDKLGNRSNASAEVEFEGAEAWLLGAPGRGIATILEMVQLTRLDCVIGSAGIMRAAVARAAHFASHRIVSGSQLHETPLMRNVLADVALEAEAALHLALALAASFETEADEAERSLARLLVPAAKYWVCKRAPMVALECMEAMGGNGYVEESVLPRLYREAPVNSIWEGSGNVICLDVQRATKRNPASVEALRARLASVRGEHRGLDRAAARIDALLDDAADPASARRLAQAVATSVAAVALIRHAPAAVADAYCASRLADDTYAGAAFGTLPSGCDSAAIVRRIVTQG